MNSDPNSSYQISHEKIVLRLKILDLDSLFIHEEIIPEMLNFLAESIKNDNLVKHPIIVDENSLVVLDGMHRVAALRKIGYERIPVCLVDYKNPNIKVRCWYRTLKGSNIHEKMMETAKKLGLTLKKDEESNKTRIGKENFVLGFKDNNGFYLVRGLFRDLKEAYDLVKLVEESLKSFGLEVRHETESDAARKFDQGLVDAIILTPKLSKEDIVNVALSGMVFSYKATRHIIPARPLYVNVPLKLLNKRNHTLEEANEKFRQMLLKKHLKMVSAGSLLEGRRYEEDVYIFED
mgnify:CR=1 FL=1